MPIKGYTTDKSTASTVADLQKLLARKGARAVMVEYDGAGEASAIAFRVQVAAHGQDRLLSFRLVAIPEPVYAALVADPKVPRKLRTIEQAARVAWRLVHDWADVQLAFVEAGQASLAQVLLGYTVTPDGRSFFDLLIEGEEGQRLLTSKLEVQ